MHETNPKPLTNLDNRGDVLLAMSGGIDSTVAAYLLNKEGYRVTGVTYLLGDSERDHESLKRGERAAHSLGIDWFAHDARETFKKQVVDLFASEYISGRTPSICMHCNPLIKWKILLDYSTTGKWNYIATGHYARILEENGQRVIARGVDKAKDQSYYLWKLDQKVLAKALFPLGEYTKSDIRQIARDQGIPDPSGGKESMGVCFLGKEGYREFLTRSFPERTQSIGKGKVLDPFGRQIGVHDGYPFYTAGQKRGLHLHMAGNWAVKAIHPPTNEIIADDPTQLYSSRFTLEDWKLSGAVEQLSGKITATVRGFGWNPGGWAHLEACKDGELEVNLDEPAWALAPGQPVVFYHDEKVIGGGIIARPYT
jgi:tRNA-uridine 2-sulfurtransferase